MSDFATLSADLKIILVMKVLALSMVIFGLASGHQAYVLAQSNGVFRLSIYRYFVNTLN